VGELGVGYAPVTLGAQGGVPPYKWTIASGLLPAGLALTSAGSVSGKPTAIGPSSFVIRVDDSAGGAAGAPRTISVVAHLAVNGTCTTRCSVEAGCVTVCGRYGTQSGGVAPFKYQVTVGQIPTGMGLKGLNLTGAFTQPISNCDCTPLWSFSILVTDALGATDATNAVYNVFQHITLYPNGSCVGDYLNGCSVTLFYSGGSGAIDVTTSNASNTLPDGYSATASGGEVLVSFPSGIGNGWNGSIDLTLTDQSPCGPGTLCTSNTVTVPVQLNGS
jgi:hypothetical protein